MADDNQDLVSRTVAFRQWRFSIRELILGGLVILGVLLFLVFAGLYGQKSSDLKDTSAKLTAASRPQCTERWCFETIAHVETFVNSSNDPCDNFFQFACGSYKVARELDPGRDLYISVFQELRQNNEDALTDLLTSGRLPRYMNQSSAERKLKEFYASCMDDFTIEQLKGTPLINRAYPLLGGSYIIDPNWNPSTWSFSSALEKTQTDFYVDAFFAPRVRVDQTNSSRRIISIFPGGTGRNMRWSDYLSPTKQKLRNDYKKFMTTVAKLVARDAGLTVGDPDLATRIGVFVDDAFTVETDIARFASNSRYQKDAYTEAQKVSLDGLNQEYGNEIDWTQQMSYLFNEAQVTGSTKVVIPYPTYIGNLTVMIRGLDPAKRNRMLHNYLTWRVLEVYVQDLSWEYVHANRQVFVDKYGYANFLGTQKYCFRLAQTYFNIALSSLYVYTNFEKKNKDKVKDITETVKTAIENTITVNTWMDQDTKDYAIAKMRGSTYKIGYPDFMDDETQVDKICEKLSINKTDFFGNLLACNMQHRREWNRRLREGENRDEWIFNAYTTNMAVYWYWDEVIVPAGILQFPMYMYDMPHYYSFGAIGTQVGRFVHHLIDDRGRRWDKGGDLIKADNGWWSNQTVENFNVAKQCVADIYNNVTQGPYFSYNGQDVTLSVDGDEYAGEAMTITTGIRLAYNAYKMWQQKHGTDPYPPGLKYTPEQLFFIAHAQVFCYNRDPFWDYIYTLFYKNANEETRVNVALQELPEFSQAFGCSPSDNMVPDKRCDYY